MLAFQSKGGFMTPALTILIADHHEDVLNVLKEQLATTNYALLHARNGEEAIALLERLKSKIELAIIDLELPDFSGWGPYRAAHATRPKTPQDYRYHVAPPPTSFEEYKRDGKRWVSMRSFGNQ
jgi:CheY-like chemotaxis protein